MRKRLEELNWRTQHSLNSRDHEEAVGIFDSPPGKGISTPVSLKAQRRKDIA